MEKDNYVLLVEDDPLQYGYIANLLKPFNCKINPVPNVEEGLVKLTESEKRPFMIFLDYNLVAGLTGMDFIEKLNNDERYSEYRKIPLIGIGDFPEQERKHLTEYCNKSSLEDRVGELVKKYLK